MAGVLEGEDAIRLEINGRVKRSSRFRQNTFQTTPKIIGPAFDKESWLMITNQFVVVLIFNNRRRFSYQSAAVLE